MSKPILHPLQIDLTGETFGRLIAVGYDKALRRWKCVCSCGNETNVASSNLRNRVTTSCGCYQKSANIRHGMSGPDSPEYRAWVGMWSRCTNINDKGYELYKHRTPPVSWRDFLVFFTELGPRPSPQHSLDRKNNDLPYGPGNCRWATVEEQLQNRSVSLPLQTLNGETKSVSDWARQFGVSYSTLYARVRRGVSLEEALSTPVKSRNQTKLRERNWGGHLYHSLSRAGVV